MSKGTVKPAKEKTMVGTDAGKKEAKAKKPAKVVVSKEVIHPRNLRKMAEGKI
jgi:hypothetical protein